MEVLARQSWADFAQNPRDGWHGHGVRTLFDQFEARPIEIRQLPCKSLNLQQPHELIEEMRAGVPPL
jgi:hypothetical protein